MTTKNLIFTTWVLGSAMALTACTPGNESSGTAVKLYNFTAQKAYDTDSGSYKVTYSFETPAAPSLIDTIELREIDAAIGAEATCSSGLPVETWNGPFESFEKIKGRYFVGSVDRFKYLFCVKSLNGEVNAYQPASNVASAASVIGAQASKEKVGKLTTGQFFSCALFSNQQVKCWGQNEFGQLGLESTSHRGDQAGEMGNNLDYVDIGTKDGNSNKKLEVIDVQSGLNHSCVIIADGRVKCWGRNHKGQLGYGDTKDRGATAGTMGDKLPFVNLGTGLTAKQLGMGQDFTCALLSNNTVKCWGDNQYGNLGRGNKSIYGDGTNEMGNSLPPVDLGTGRTARSIAVGHFHACAILDNNSVKCWGANDFGQLGQGRGNATTLIAVGDEPYEMGNNLPSVNLGSGLTARSISASTSHTCAVLSDYNLKCWGDNYAGQLGLGSTAAFVGTLASEMGDGLPKVNLGTLLWWWQEPVTSVQVGMFTTCAVLITGRIKCWGQNVYGQIGIGSSDTAVGDVASEMGDGLDFVETGLSKPVKSMSSDYGTTCVITTDNNVKCWGINVNGSLGLGDNTSRGSLLSHMGDNLPELDL
jgi:alpha-tubulin suppressor-like RCC1 family protein